MPNRYVLRSISLVVTAFHTVTYTKYIPKIISCVIKEDADTETRHGSFCTSFYDP